LILSKIKPRLRQILEEHDKTADEWQLVVNHYRLLAVDDELREQYGLKDKVVKTRLQNYGKRLARARRREATHS
jgi:hypothetical protein